MPRFARALCLCLTILGSLLASSATRAEGPAVQHLVLFRFADDVEWSRLGPILSAFEALPAKIPGIIGFQWGTNSSPEGLAQGFTHGFVVTFENAAARDAYITHPEHEAFVGIVRPALADVFVVDFAVEKPMLAAEPGRVHHLVFFDFKDDASAEQIDGVNAAFAGLERRIPGLLGYQAGANNSPEGLSRGYTHGYLLTFVNDRARDDYLPHPAHREFGKIVGPVLEKPLVLDFTVRPQSQHLFIVDGLEPYRVYQRGGNGRASLEFSGFARGEGTIEARLREGRRTVPGSDWKEAGTATMGAFRAALEAPTGGPYTVEVRLRDALGNVAAHTEVADVLVGDLWILAGQSNMEGVGNLADVEPPHPLVHAFTMAHRWERAEEPLHWLSESPDEVHSGRWYQNAANEDARRAVRADYRARRTKGAGLGLPFARELVSRTGVPIGLIASAHGGTSMEQWDPSRRDEGGSSLYGSMLKQVRNAGGKVKGVLWYQGESDANPRAVPLFAERLAGLIAAFRSDLKSPQLPFYQVQIGRFVRDGDAGDWDRIQELQRLASREIPGTAVISVIDLQLDDLIHVGTSGLVRAGRRLARIAHRELFGASHLEQGPRLASVMASEDGRLIRVRYEGVNGRLLPAEKVEGFSIHKADGTREALIYKAFIDPRSSDTVILELQRPLAEEHRLAYGAGYDPVCNLVDAEDQAALVFGPLAIER